MQLVESIMTKSVITVEHNMVLHDVLHLISEHKISFVVVVRDSEPVGVITERDIVRFTVEGINIDHLAAKDVMSSPVVSLEVDKMDVAEAYHRLKLKNKRHLVVVSDTGSVCGVVTLTDFIKHLGIEAFIEHKPLSHILTASPIWVTPDYLVLDAMRLMVQHKISCMMVCENEQVVGILTERDIARIKASGNSTDDVPISQLMKSPVLTVLSSMNTSDASDYMREKGIRHLAVVDDHGLLIGVVTETNIMKGMEGRYVQSLVRLLDEKDEELRAVNASLSQRVKERTKALRLEIEAHKAVEDTMEKLAHALEQAGEAVLITDARGIIEYVNTAFTQTTGFSMEEVLGKNPSILQSGRQGPSFYRHMWDTINLEGGWKGVIWNKRKDGEVYPEQLHIRPIKNENEQVVNYIGTFSDISEKVALEAEYQHAQRMETIGSLVGGVAHNFNNILAGISGKLYLAVKKTEEKSEVMPYLKSMEDLSMRAAEMVRQLLTFARKDFHEKKVFPLLKLMRETVNTSRLGIPESIELLENLGGEDLPIYGDAMQVQQVMMNIINNARDAMTETHPRIISVTLEHFHATQRFLNRYPQLGGRELACVSIKDTGEGIAEHHLERVFEPFFSTKSSDKGTGLGLSMSKGAIDSHGGVIEVLSGVDGGTEFKIYLPLAIHETGEELSSSEDVQEGQGQLILLVDDELSVVEGTKDILQSIGYRVVSATDGEEALLIFEAYEKEIALVLTDIVLPKMGGYELVKNIREYTDIPAIFMTGYSYEQTTSSIPSSMVIHKPFSVPELSALLYKALEI